jgi:hypothetical protein
MGSMSVFRSFFVLLLRQVVVPKHNVVFGLHSRNAYDRADEWYRGRKGRGFSSVLSEVEE